MTKKEARHYFAQKESTVFQWKYLSHILATFFGFFLIILFNGPGGTPSVVGIERCDPAWWGLFSTLFMFGFLMLGIGIWMQRNEYQMKQNIDWTFTPCDYKFSMRTAIPYALFAFVASFLAILSGFTPAFFYYPFLYTLHLQPEQAI